MFARSMWMVPSKKCNEVWSDIGWLISNSTAYIKGTTRIIYVWKEGRSCRKVYQTLWLKSGPFCKDLSQRFCSSESLCRMRWAGSSIYFRDTGFGRWRHEATSEERRWICLREWKSCISCRRLTWRKADLIFSCKGNKEDKDKETLVI